MFIHASYRFLEHLRVVKNASEHTIRNYAIDLNALKIYLEKELLTECKAEDLPEKISHTGDYNDRWKGKDDILVLNVITRQHIRGFLAKLNENNQNKKTIVRRLSSLRSFFKYAITQNLISANPVEELETPKIEKSIPASLTYDQVQKLFAQPDSNTLLGLRDRVILELLFSSGLRVSELVGLNRADFDASNLLIKLRGKGKKERLIPITKNAASWMTSYLEHPERYLDMDGHQAQVDSNAVFLNKLGTRLTVRSVDRNFDKYFRGSGIADKATPHTMRHTIAKLWLENGMDLKIIQEILGHQSLATTTIYTQVSTKLKKKVYDKAHPRAK